MELYLDVLYLSEILRKLNNLFRVFLTMGESYKILGGLGYILSIIPVVNFIGGLLVGAGWLSLGGRARDGLFKATGIFILLSSVLGIAGVAVMFVALGGLPTVTSPEEVGALIASMSLTILGLLIVAGILGLISFILQVASFFRAGKKFDNGAFRAAGWLSIITVLLGIIIGAAFVLLILLPAMRGGEVGLEVLGGLIGGIIGVVILGILGLITNILAAVGFFTLKLPTEYPAAPPPTYPPPPPPSYPQYPPT
ncbi:MAG: hypothetical protein DRJ63_07400 [Thermoprotei archaeon]|nr:MAG: hypothetical protein DRJ63_07400 [Thermoprotei archaeon]